MSSFNFIESFFLLSLGITFVLIVLLVYHFKQRLSSMEQKCDTMFDIVQNLVKEMTSVKQAVSKYESGMGDVPYFPKHLPDTVFAYGDGNDDGDEDDDDDDDDQDEDDSDEDDSDEDEGSGSDSESDEDVKVISLDESIKLDDIVTENDNDQESSADANEMVELQETEPIEIHKVESAPTSYKKMTVSELRAVVTSKGIATNPGKLSKTDLLKLLE